MSSFTDLLRNPDIRNLIFRWKPVFPPAVIILAALSTAIRSWIAVDMSKTLTLNNEYLTLDPKCQFDSYDYIVVGGGTAGMVVATRLANASRNIRVLLLEAGGEPHVLNQVPILAFLMMNQPNCWLYPTTPQDNSSYGVDGRRTHSTRGKMLGGSSSLNFMMYARGHKQDFNRWAIDAGDDQWNYENLLPYFKKSEDYNGAYDGPSAYKYHGKGGLLNIAKNEYRPGCDQFLDAAREKGYKIGDYNGEDQDGEVFSQIDILTQNGWRESTYRAFYQDTGKPRNLCIKKYALATKINFDMRGGTPKAVSVTYQRQSRLWTVTATKEIIISGGTFESAKLLMLSGIGPKDHLDEMNIPVVKDLPVGQGLQDHVYTIAPFLKSPGLNPENLMTSGNIKNFIFRGKGPVTSPSGFAGLGFIQSPNADPPYPNIQIIQFSSGFIVDLSHVINKAIGLDIEILEEWWAPYSNTKRDVRMVIIYVGRPKSVGEVRLASRNPKDLPIINPRYLSDPDDVESLLYAYKKVVNLYENSYALNAPLFPKPYPNCAKLEFKSDDYYKCVIKHVSGSFYHHVGTCALGKVVDRNLRVKGVNGLRVIDASVIPRTPNANTVAATTMIGEKGADLIIKDLRKRNHGK